MELLLAFVVATAVILFGALISLGNERQRRAIDGVKEQLTLWAKQDLQIKREQLSRNVQVDNPLQWLSSIASKVSGLKLNLDVVDYFDDTELLICVDQNSGQRILVSPLNPKAMKKGTGKKRSRLTQPNDSIYESIFSNQTSIFEVSVLNGGYSFDLELSIVWENLTKKSLGAYDTIWIYVI